jgi:hypothetical protein
LGSLEQTLEKIIEKDKGRNKVKISLIKFASKADLVYENIHPREVHLNIKPNGGGTNF